MRCLTYFAAVAVMLCTYFSESAEAQRLGLVKEKPASEPFVETDQGFMVPYTVTIPGSDISFEMVPIPGGTFKMGSPDGEEGRGDVEGPQVEVHVEPMWVGKYEVTWSEYKLYMALHDLFKEFESAGMRKINSMNQVDVITAPSNLYDPTFTFEAGDGPRQPAVTMTQYSAKQYTKWLSLLTQDFYRLPTEAEWEYACRAGTTTAYSFGDDPSKLGDYAFYDENSGGIRQDVGQKLPNPWGLYDMHGNAAEWVLDSMTDDGYESISGNGALSVMDALQWPEEVYPRCVRGGSWELYAEECRSASRLGSEDEEWKDQDPNIPLSPWWFTTSPSTGVGMRLFRPLNAPEEREDREYFWEADHEEMDLDVEYRIDNEGRGARGYVDPELPKAIEELKNNR